MADNNQYFSDKIRFELSNGVGNTLDISKCVAALIVVGIHQHPFMDPLYFYTWGIFSRFAIPFFFITSAFLFFSKNPCNKDLKNYVTRLLKLYLFWLIVTFPYTIYIRCDFSQGLFYNILHFVHILINDSTFRGSWFIMASIIAVSIVFCLGKYLKNWQLLLFGIITELFLHSYTYLQYYPKGISDFLTGFNTAFPDVHTSWIRAIIYVVLGKLIVDNYNKIQNISRRVVLSGFLIIAAIMSAYVIWIHNFTDAESTRTLLLVPAVILLFITLLKTKISLNINYIFLRHLSTVMYISHFVFKLGIRYISKYIPFLDLSPFTSYILIVLCSISLTILLTFFQKKPKLNWLKYAW